MPVSGGETEGLPGAARGGEDGAKATANYSAKFLWKTANKHKGGRGGLRCAEQLSVVRGQFSENREWRPRWLLLLFLIVRVCEK